MEMYELFFDDTKMKAPNLIPPLTEEQREWQKMLISQLEEKYFSESKQNVV